MPDNVISDPDHDDLDITSGDPSLSEYRGWMREGWVGLARTSPCEDEYGKVKIEINFEPVFVTVQEAAVLLRVTPSTIRRLIQQGKLDLRQFGSERRITWESLVVLAEIQYPTSD